MSASLPRIKTVHEINQNPLNEQPLKLKFRKLALDPSENGEERKKSVRTLKTQRLKSLQRYTTVQEQREFKNQKIHLNLIERKLLSGTYDQKKQTGNELNVLKQKRDNIKVETALKQREIDRLRVALEEIKKQVGEFLAKRGEHDGKLKSIKDKHENQLEKTEAARQTKAVLQNMIKIRHDVNLVLCKRHNDLKQNLSHLQSAMTLIETELREATEKCAIQEGKLEDLLQKSSKERSDRNQQIAKHQEKISRRKEGEVLQTEKSREYIAHLDEVERQSEFRNFKLIYNKILANLFITRYCKESMLELTNKYQKYENSYKLVSSYHSFDPEKPSTLVQRFMEHEPQKISKQKFIEDTQKKVLTLQQKNRLLKLELSNLESDFMDTSWSNSIGSAENKMSKQKLQIIQVRNDEKEVSQKSQRIKGNILRLLRDLNQKGDRKIDAGYQPALNNLTLLVQITKQLAEI